ncbi:MAG TPA: hypothetical protein VG944_17890 [Fimbriimonas sp.]|nr:hypothetical protein [Fimbriimonas sp.]
MATALLDASQVMRATARMISSGVPEPGSRYGLEGFFRDALLGSPAPMATKGQ